MEYRLNIFKQISGFYSKVFSGEIDYRPSHASLYMFLLNQNNRVNWCEWFKCPYDLAMAGCGINSKATYYKTLHDLESFGFIEYQKGVNDFKAPKIKIIDLSSVSYNIPLSDTLTEQVSVPLSEQQPVQLSEQQYAQQPVHNNKQITKNDKLINEYKDVFEKNYTLIEKYLISLKKQKPFHKIYFTDNPNTDYEKLCNWIITEYKNVNKMDDQMTEQQLNAIIEKYGKEKLFDILSQMENKKDLTKKYVSVYLTARNWLKK